MDSDLVLYTYKCIECAHVGDVQLAGDGHEGERAECKACGAGVSLEWDGGVAFHVGPHLANLSENSMVTLVEATANEAIKDALQALQRAREMSERAGYGSMVVGPLMDAQRETQYALNTVLGRN